MNFAVFLFAIFLSTFVLYEFSFGCCCDCCCCNNTTQMMNVSGTMVPMNTGKIEIGT